MSFNKNSIIKNISKRSAVSVLEGGKFLESFLLLIKSNALSKSVKLSGFGSFSFKKTPKRFGRNPKTKDSYIIPERNKMNFISSNKVRHRIN